MQKLTALFLYYSILTMILEKKVNVVAKENAPKVLTYNKYNYIFIVLLDYAVGDGGALGIAVGDDVVCSGGAGVVDGVRGDCC